MQSSAARAALLLLAAVFALPAQTPERPLQPGASLSVALKGAETAAWRLDVPAGQTVRVFLHELEGIAGIVAVEDLDGAPVVRLDCTIRTPAAKGFTLLAGSYRLTVRPSYHTPGDRKFEIQTAAPAPETPVDRSHASAERLEGEGERIYRQYQTGYLAAAQEKYEAALSVFERLGDPAWQADVLGHLADIVYEQGQMSRAIELFKRELDLWKTVKDDAGTAAALYGLGIVSGDTGQAQQALEYLTQSLNLRRALNDLRGQAEALYVRGGIQILMGQTESGRMDFDEGLRAARASGEHNREADIEIGLGLYEYRLGNFPGAIQHWSIARAIAMEEHEPARTAQALSNLGAAYLNSGDPRQALGYLQQALPIRKATSFPSSYANTLYNVAMAQLDLGEYQPAIDNLNLALPIFQKEQHLVGEASTLQGLAQVAVEMGRDGQAVGYLKQSLEIRRQASDRRGQADTLLRLGAIDGRLGNASPALNEEREALTIAKAANLQPEQARALAAIGEALLAAGNPAGDAAGALDSLKEAVAASHKIGARGLEAHALDLEGRAYVRVGQLPQARQALEQALAFGREAGLDEREAATLFDLAKLDRQTGAPAEAASHAAAALDLVESLRARFGSRQERIESASSHRKYYDLAIQLAMDAGDSARAFALSERARTRGLVDLLAEAGVKISRGIDPALLARRGETEELLNAKYDRFLQLLDSPHTAAREAAARQEIDGLLDGYTQTDAQIRAASPEYAALTQPQPPSLAQTQALLPPQGTALVEFWLGEARSFAWVVSKSGCRVFPLPARAEVEAAARRVNDDFQAAGARPPSAASDAEQLSKLLAPVLEAAASARRWWLVADGALAYVPFAGLPTAPSAAPLAASHEVVELPSASALAEVRRQIANRPPAPEELAVFADPVYRSDDPRVSPAPAKAAPAEEVQAIEALAPAAHRWIALDFDASRAEVEKPQLARYRIVDFATRCSIDSRHPELSGIALSTVDRQGRPQDGFLRLNEIYNLKLNADIVVLSACQTTLGESARGEGIVGLTRGFLYAGAPQVLASLWSVNDRATTEFLRRFYDALLRRGLPAAAALQSAQLALLNDPGWKDPYYWSAFVLQGSL